MSLRNSGKLDRGYFLQVLIQGGKTPRRILGKAGCLGKREEKYCKNWQKTENVRQRGKEKSANSCKWK